MKRIVMVMFCVMLVAALFVVACGGEPNPTREDYDAPEQPLADHASLCTSGGSMRDDELADYICSKIPKDTNGVPQVKDVKIMCQQCYGGGMADDFGRVFGEGGACDGVPWVFGSASEYDETSRGWADDASAVAACFGDPWTDALAGTATSPSDATPGSIRDRASDNVQDDLVTAGNNDDSGPNHDDEEHPVVASGNGGANIVWNAPGTNHEAVLFAGCPNRTRHHKDLNKVEGALKGVWPAGSYNIQKIDGGSKDDLKRAIDAACAALNKTTELVLYFSDHGDREFDLAEFMQWSKQFPLPFTIPVDPTNLDRYYLNVEFDLDAGWQEGLKAMYSQDEGPSPFISLTLADYIQGREWDIFLNDAKISLPQGEITAGELQLPVDWTSIYTGTNNLTILSHVNASGPMMLHGLELSSGPIDQIEQ